MLKGFFMAKAIGLLAILMLPLSSFAATGGGCWLRDAAAPTTTNIFALCQQGVIYISSDGGAKWDLLDTGAKSFLRTIVFTNASHGIVAGDAGTVMTSEDSGKTWQLHESKTKENLLAVTAVGSDAWASGFDGAIVHSSDGGRSWETQNSTTTLALEDIYFIDKDHGWAAGWSGTILRTVDGGKKWQPVVSKAQWSLTALYFKDASNGWAVGFSGQLLRTKDGGVSWDVMPPPSTAWLKDVAVDSANRIWIASDDALLVSEDQGAHWKSVQAAKQAFLKKFVPVGNSLWAVGQLALLRQVGTDWKQVDSLQVLSSSDSKALLARQDIATQSQQNTAPKTQTAPKK